MIRITGQPSPVRVSEGEQATYSIEAQGGGLTYQWQQRLPGSGEYVNISGATQSTYTTPATVLSQRHTRFRCVITDNEGDSVTSNSANLYVHTAASSPITAPDADAPVVYMTTDISSNGLMAAYNALGRRAAGSNVAVKISTGEPGGNHFLAPSLIRNLVQSVNGTIVESNTAYGGQRSSTALHYQVAEDHGFTAIAPVVIMDENGEMQLPVANGKHLRENTVGAHFAEYDFHIVLSHFKGHAMGGFGGAMKNLSIGYASPTGKNLIHTAGNNANSPWGGNSDHFLESMAEAASSVMDAAGDNILYVNVMNHLSVDCDCSSNPAEPTMDDIAILASLDPVALDKACVDLVYAASDGQDLVRRIESVNGVLTLEHAAELGIGSLEYELVSIDD